MFLNDRNIGYHLQVVFTTAKTIQKNGIYRGLVLWFINGTYIDWDFSYTRDFKYEGMVTKWHEGYNLQFLDRVRHNESTWFEERSTKLYRARIFFQRVAVVNEYETVAALYAEGIANSAPVSISVTAEINEDGEAADHYYDPGLYLQGFERTELQKINLSIYDSDNDPTTLKYSEASQEYSSASCLILDISLIRGRVELLLQLISRFSAKEGYIQSGIGRCSMNAARALMYEIPTLPFLIMRRTEPLPGFKASRMEQYMFTSYRKGPPEGVQSHLRLFQLPAPRRNHPHLNPAEGLICSPEWLQTRRR